MKRLNHSVAQNYSLLAAFREAGRSGMTMSAIGPCIDTMMKEKFNSRIGYNAPVPLRELIHRSILDGSIMVTREGSMRITDQGAKNLQIMDGFFKRQAERSLVA